MRAYQFLLEYDQGKTLTKLGPALLERMNPDRIFIQTSETFWTPEANQIMYDWSTALMHDHTKAWDEMHDLLGRGRQMYKVHIKRILTPYWNEQKIVKWIIEFAEESDPTRKKNYVPTILRWFINFEVALEDMYKCKEAFEIYVKFRNRITGLDLRTISWHDFQNRMLDEQKTLSQKDAEDAEYQSWFTSGQAELVEDNSTYRILIPKTKDAAIFFGKNTQWCTSASYSNNMFDYYNRQGPLYIVLFKAENQRWQFHFETGQFMDERDHEIHRSRILASPIVAWFDSHMRLTIDKDVRNIFKMCAPTVDDFMHAIDHEPRVMIWFHTRVFGQYTSTDPAYQHLREVWNRMSVEDRDGLFRYAIDKYKALNAKAAHPDFSDEKPPYIHEIDLLLDMLTRPTRDEAARLITR